MTIFTVKSAVLILSFGAAIAGVPGGAAEAKVTDQTYRWKSVAIGAGGFVSGIMFHPAQKNLLYCRTDIGGAYRWDQKASHWIPLLDWLTNPDWNLYGIESLGLDPSDPKRLYLACGTYTNDWAGNGAILRSDDQGRTFKRTDLPFKNGGNMPGLSIGERLEVYPIDGKTLYFGTRGNGLWRSSDRAETWHQVDTFLRKETPNNVGVGIVVFDPRTGSKGSSSKTVYVFVADKTGGIYRSTDGGVTWSKVPGQPQGFYAHHAYLGSNGRMIVTFGNAQGPNDITGGAVYSLDTATDTWTDISPDRKGGFGYAGLSVDPRHPDDIVVSTLDRWTPGDDVFRTRDGGKTWTAMREKSTRDASLAPYMKWGKDAATFGWWTSALAMDPFNTAHIAYGTGANIWTTFKGSDEATHWAVGGLGIEETACIDLLSPAVGPHLISALGDIGGFTHDNLDLTPQGGMTSNPQLSNTDCLDSAGLAPSTVVRVGRPDRGEQPGGYSTDAGESWKPFVDLPPRTRGSGSIALTADGNNAIWAPARSTPWVQTLGQNLWLPTAGVPGPSRVVADRVNPSKVYALVRREALCKHRWRNASVQSRSNRLKRQTRAVPRRRWPRR